MRLQDWPSLRLVIPLIAGIIISDTILNTRAQVPVLCILDVLAVFIVLFLISDSKPCVSGLFLSVSFVLAGAFSYTLQMERVRVVWPGHQALYHGVLDSYPLERERTFRLEVTLAERPYAGRKIYLYLPKDSAAMMLEPGRTIAFYGKINEPSSEGVGFDYAKYLLNHGISGTTYVRAKDWESAHPDVISLRNRCIRLRQKIISRYREWGLQGNALAVVSAVTLGERSALGNELKEVYSVSGVSHVLAVSGLHVGIMCWFLYILFPSVLFKNRKWVRELLVMGLLWTYAFAVGMQVSITRSLIMFSIVSVCRAIGREGSALNSLGVAALILLIINPSSLFDVSFQLSFSAVLFIVILTPALMEIYKPRTLSGRYMWRVSVLSTTAQAGTFPIVMYHFSGFSTYFLFANLFVVTVMFVVVALSMSLWIMAMLSPVRELIVNILTWIIDIMTSFLSRIATLPYSHPDLSIQNGWSLLLVYAVMILLCLWIKEARAYRMLQALALIAAASILVLIQHFAV